MHADFFEAKIDEPGFVEEFLRQKRPVSYVVAFEIGGQITDVTTRYSFKPDKTIELVPKKIREQWHAHLENLTAGGKGLLSCSMEVLDSIDDEDDEIERGESDSGGKSESGVAAMRGTPTKTSKGRKRGSEMVDEEFANRQREEQEEMTRAQASKLRPDTKAGWSKCTLFVLNREDYSGMKVCEAINPIKARACIGKSGAGQWEGFNYFPRFVVETIKRRKDWREEGKDVVEDAKPVKTRTLKRRDGQGTYDVDLFGSWQTKELVVPGVEEDGLIPVNSYGNVEVWGGNLFLVPKGARYIATEKIALFKIAAEQLGVQCVEAVVGFENDSSSKSGDGFGFGMLNGNSVPRRPKIGGVVVLEKDLLSIQRSADQLLEEALVDAKEQQYERVCAKWIALVGAALRRQAMRVKYGA